jgi:hypothetical protein
VFKKRTLITAGGVAAVCATAGVIAGIAGTAAAPSKSGSSTAPAGHPFRLGMRMRMHRLGGPPVHGELVVPNRAGTGFDTVTIDNGKFKSLSGNQLTITEGTQKATYKTVTLTIPSNAVVRRNWSPAKLSDLRAGDEVHVLVGPRGTFVSARDAKHQFMGPEGAMRKFRGFRGFRGPGGGPPGPPPGAPGPGAGFGEPPPPGAQ